MTGKDHAKGAMAAALEQAFRKLPAPEAWLAALLDKIDDAPPPEPGESK